MEDESFGIIPLRKKNNGWQVLLIKHKHGAHWGFPKGHPINDREAEIETASREFKEHLGMEIYPPGEQSVSAILNLVDEIINTCNEHQYALSEFSRDIADMDYYLLFYYNQKNKEVK